MTEIWLFFCFWSWCFCVGWQPCLKCQLLRQKSTRWSSVKLVMKEATNKNTKWTHTANCLWPTEKIVIVTLTAQTSKSFFYPWLQQKHRRLLLLLTQSRVIATLSVNVHNEVKNGRKVPAHYSHFTTLFRLHEHPTLLNQQNRLPSLLPAFIPKNLQVCNCKTTRRCLI